MAPDRIPVVEASGFWWPAGAEAYHHRYLKCTDDMRDALAFTPGRRVAIQAGGNVGVWPAWLAPQFDAVYTIEPDAANFYALCRNVCAPNVYKFQAALSDLRGTIGLHRSAKNIGGHRTSGPGPIPTLRIDDLHVPACDVLILDVEGSEFPALRGARATLEAYRPVLMLEDRGHGEKIGHGSFRELAAWLAPLGYRERSRIHKDVVLTC